MSWSISAADHLRAGRATPTLNAMNSYDNKHTDELAIEVRDLRRTYGDVQAVRGVSFEVARGEVFCLLGPNGAGKTTIVEILEGYRNRSGGEARVLGFYLSSGAGGRRRRVGNVRRQRG